MFRQIFEKIWNISSVKMAREIAHENLVRHHEESKKYHDRTQKIFSTKLDKLRLSARWATELLWQPREEYICEIVEMLCVWNVSYCILLEIKLLLLQYVWLFDPTTGMDIKLNWDPVILVHMSSVKPIKTTRIVCEITAPVLWQGQVGPNRLPGARLTKTYDVITLRYHKPWNF